MQSNFYVLCEVPRIAGKACNVKVTEKFTAYHVPSSLTDSNENVMFEGNFQDFCFESADLIEEGINFLHMEAMKILAFVATGCQ